MPGQALHTHSRQWVKAFARALLTAECSKNLAATIMQRLSRTPNRRSEMIYEHKNLHFAPSPHMVAIDCDQADIQLEILGYSKEGGK